MSLPPTPIDPLKLFSSCLLHRNELKRRLFLRCTTSEVMWVTIHLITCAEVHMSCVKVSGAIPACQSSTYFPHLCPLAESSSACDLLQRFALLFFWAAYAPSRPHFLCASDALLTLVNNTSPRSAATGGDDIFHTKGLICNLSCRNKAVRINNILLINLSASGV